MSDRNSTFQPGDSGSIFTSKPGFGVAHSTVTPDAENEIAVVPPVRVNVIVSASTGGTVVELVGTVVELVGTVVDVDSGGPVDVVEPGAIVVVVGLVPPVDPLDSGDEVVVGDGAIVVVDD